MFGFKKQKKSGFTLIETIIALTLGTLIIAVIMTVVISGMKRSASIKRTGKLHSDAVFLIDNFNYLIKQGESLDVEDNILTIIFPDSELEIKLEQEEIKAKDLSLTDKNIIEVVELNFTEMTRSVRINFTLKAKNAEEKISITTTIAHRN